jgi:hypothetical protein
LASPSHVPVDQFTVGSLVTVIGEVVGIHDKDDGWSSNALQPALVKMQSHEASPTHYLQARILQRAEGVNMKLYTDALLVRRKHLLSLGKADRKALAEAPTTILRQGCGPPPYNTDDDEPIK